MLTVLALGGNALLRPGDEPGDGFEAASLAPAVDAIAAVDADRRLVITHGNGPQVGLLALLAANSPEGLPAPLDVLGAETEGQIGYLIDRELAGRTDRPVATILTQTIVDVEDPAFAQPSKPIGPTYAEPGAQKLSVERGWIMAFDGEAYRRVIASPEPVEIVETKAIGLLAEHGAIVVCCGGGGVPVAKDGAGSLRGVEAVVDKDLASALLAIVLAADELILLTDVEGVFDGWGTDAAQLVRDADPRLLRGMPLAPGSMGPKAEACARFVEATGGRAAVGAIEDAASVLGGSAGTQVRRC